MIRKNDQTVRSLAPVRMMLVFLLSIMTLIGHAANDATRFKRIPLQFIAALGDPAATSGVGAEQWGIWEIDPGPRSVWLFDYPKLKAADGVAPANWQFDEQDWWLEEHGLIMEAPTFPLAAGQYVVTGDREVTTILTVHEADEHGDHRWELDHGATLYDVTHLPCRSARYSPIDGGDGTSPSGDALCSPAAANQEAFPVIPGDEMPAVEGCHKQDYAVLFVIGVAVSAN